MSQVFRTKESTITDEDIDLILQRGEQKTAEVGDLDYLAGILNDLVHVDVLFSLSLFSQMNEKLKEHVGMKDHDTTLRFDGKMMDTSMDEEQLLTDHQDEDYEREMVAKLAAAMPKRERKKK